MFVWFGDLKRCSELENYPFDVQPLTVQLKLARQMPDGCHFEFKNPAIDAIPLRDTEWSPIGCQAKATFVPTSKKSETGSYKMTIEVAALRDYSVREPVFVV
jgi:hypothetical protein